MNMEKYSERVRGFLQSAQTYALAEGHQQFTPEHILKILLDDPEGMAASLIQRAGGRPEDARMGVEAALAKLPKVSGGNGQIRRVWSGICFAASRSAAVGEPSEPGGNHRRGNRCRRH